MGFSNALLLILMLGGFRQKSTSFATKQTSKIRYLAFPLGYPPAPHFHRRVSMRNGSLSKKSYGLFAARSSQFHSCFPRNTPRIPTSISPFSIYLIPLSFWPPERGDSAEKSTFMHNFLPNSAQKVGRAIRYHTPHYLHFKRTKD